MLPSFREVGARGAAPSAARWAPAGLPPRVGLVGARVLPPSLGLSGRRAPSCCPFPLVGGAPSAALVVRVRWRPFATEG